MKLFHFPYVPLKGVLDHMSIDHIFYLSLCSKKTKSFIIRAQKYQFKKVEYAYYWTNGRGAVIRVKTISGALTVIMILFNSEAGYCTRKLENIRLNELGAPIDFWRDPADNLQASFCSDNAQSTVESILNHLYDLLGSHIKLWCLGKFPNATFVPTVQNIQMCQIRGDLKHSEVGNILDRAICLEHFMWITRDEEDIQLRENSKLYDLDTLYLWTETSLAADVMKRFNGRHVFLWSSNISTRDVIRFLNAWKSGEKFQNLEVISILNDFKLWKIRDAVEFKEVDTEVEYSFVGKLAEREPYASVSFPVELKSHSYMVRKSDGHVASVMMTPSQIYMGVWNMTEKEFLEKFDKISHMASH